ncbi:MAG: hypothetical protein WC451_03950 [Patescibacteria group bacterium]|jgi:hypothetical protein
MPKKIKLIPKHVIAAFSSVYILVAAKVYAAGYGTEVGVGFSNDTIKSGVAYSFSDYIKNFYAFSMKAAVVLCTLMVVYAGYKYLTSRGDSSSINEAKDILFSTLMGAALLMLVVFVGSLAGVTIEIH